MLTLSYRCACRKSPCTFSVSAHSAELQFEGILFFLPNSGFVTRVLICSWIGLLPFDWYFQHFRSDRKSKLYFLLGHQLQIMTWKLINYESLA